jgi:predicted Zn finger-like uncharacterized protein
MNMATRCVACGTIFRVVQDQLKVSEGWVRCGRCDEVFNALEGLFNLDTEAPPTWQPGQAEHASRRPGAHEKTAAELDEEDRIASRFFRPEQEDVAKTPAETVAERDRAEFADAEFNTALLSEEEGGHRQPVLPPEESRARPPRKGAPGFVRHAEREARWKTPLARILLSFAFVILATTLTVQVGHHFRDQASARWPQLRPILVSWCRLADCRIEAPRRIDDVTVESSALTLAATGTDTFKLSVTLRNRGPLPVTMPSVDLTLTDTSGQLVARRAMAPSDFNVATPVLSPGVELPLQMLLTAGTPRVSGYTVELFYP